MSSTFQVIASVLLSAIPAFVWGYIFYKKDPVDKPKTVQTFLMGIASVTPILLYKWTWDYLPQVNVFNYTNQFSADLFAFTPYLFLPLGSVLAFMFVGVIEEYMKHVVVVHTDRGYFRNIDDAIEFSIIAALGFAFLENILYFYFIWEYQGGEVLAVSFAFRAIFSTFAHVLFSGIYGYYYGLAYFANPVWSEQQRKNRHPFVDMLHRVLHMKKNRIFAAEMVTTGLVMATVLHAGFNILLQMNMTFFMVPFLIAGYTYLDHLFKQKENLKVYGHITGEHSKAKTLKPILKLKKAS